MMSCAQKKRYGQTNRHQKFTPPLMRRNGQGEVNERFATSHVVGDYSREASGIRWLPAGGPAGRAWRGLFLSNDGVY